MKNIIIQATEILDKMMSNIKAMGYSLYVVLAVILFLLLFALITRRYKWLLWSFITATSVLSIYILYYVISGIQILLFFNINKFLSYFTNYVLSIGGAVILIIIILSGLISLIAGKKTQTQFSR